MQGIPLHIAAKDKHGLRAIDDLPYVFRMQPLNVGHIICIAGSIQRASDLAQPVGGNVRLLRRNICLIIAARLKIIGKNTKFPRRPDPVVGAGFLKTF